ncbi:MAG: hypothetical protein JW791_00795 [Nanoarchaeota archaeon]|nr:hypothetical protein [Nanoarchaeota archaeon]
MRKLFLLLIVFSAFSIVFAEDVGAKLNSINVEILINSDLSVDEFVTVTGFNNYTVNSSYLYVFLNDIPDDLIVTDENGTVLNQTSFVANGIFTIRILDTISPKSSKTYTLKYSNDDIIQRFDNNFVFSYYFTSYYNLSDFSLELVLPKGFGITQKDINTISPPSSRIFSDGQQIILAWEQGINYLESNIYLVFFERIAFGLFSLWWIIGSVLLGAGIGAGVTYYLLKRKRKDIVTMALIRDEKLVVDYVLDHDNEVFQNDVGKALDFSKPKLSKIVHNLEDKKILKVSPAGRKNKISVNKKVL